MTLNLKNEKEEKAWEKITEAINNALDFLGFKAQFDFNCFCWGENYKDPCKNNRIQAPNAIFDCSEVEIRLIEPERMFYKCSFGSEDDETNGFWSWNYKSTEFKIEELYQKIIDFCHIYPSYNFLTISWIDKHCHTENYLEFYKDKITWGCGYIDCYRTKSGAWVDNLVDIYSGILIEK